MTKLSDYIVPNMSYEEWLVNNLKSILEQYSELSKLTILVEGKCLPNSMTGVEIKL